MKLPEKKRKELKKRGKQEAPQTPGGGAKARLRQFEKARGIKDTGRENPADGESGEGKGGDENDPA